MALSASKAQEIESIDHFKTEKKVSNIYKNYSESDSLILFSNQTFRKSHSYFGFDKIIKKVIAGDWMKDGNVLILNVETKIDSLQIETLNPFTLKYRIENIFLESIGKFEKELRRIK